jgi:hypothetical protein
MSIPPHGKKRKDERRKTTIGMVNCKPTGGFVKQIYTARRMIRA